MEPKKKKITQEYEFETERLNGKKVYLCLLCAEVESSRLPSDTTEGKSKCIRLNKTNVCK